MPHASEHAARKKIPFPPLKRKEYLFRIEPAFVDDRDEEEFGDIENHAFDFVRIRIVGIAPAYRYEQRTTEDAGSTAGPGC